MTFLFLTFKYLIFNIRKEYFIAECKNETENAERKDEQMEVGADIGE